MRGLIAKKLRRHGSVTTARKTLDRFE